MSTTTASSALDKDPDTNLYGKKDRRFRSKVEARTAGRKAADWGNFSRSGIDELVSSAGSHEFLPGSFVSIKNIGVFASLSTTTSTRMNWGTCRSWDLKAKTLSDTCAVLVCKQNHPTERGPGVVVDDTELRELHAGTRLNPAILLQFSEGLRRSEITATTILKTHGMPTAKDTEGIGLRTKPIPILYSEVEEARNIASARQTSTDETKIAELFKKEELAGELACLYNNAVPAKVKRGVRDLIKNTVKPALIPSNTATTALASTLATLKKPPLAKALSAVRRVQSLRAGLLSPNLREESYDLSEWPTVTKTAKDGVATAFEPFKNSYLDVSDVYDIELLVQETKGRGEWRRHGGPGPRRACGGGRRWRQSQRSSSAGFVEHSLWILNLLLVTHTSRILFDNRPSLYMWLRIDFAILHPPPP